MGERQYLLRQLRSVEASENLVKHNNCLIRFRLGRPGDYVHGGRLRPLFSKLLRKPDRVAHGDVSEPRLENAVAVKINFSPVRRFEETIAFFRKEFADPAMARALQFDSATLWRA
jgi:hypothetical protein